MRRFFWKIFAWFWLTVLVIGAALAVATLYSSRLVDRKWAALATAILPTEARMAAAAFDAGGRPELNAYIYGLEKRYPVRAILFDGGGQGISDATPDSEAAQMVAMADGERTYVQRSWASQRAMGASGRAYVLVLHQEGGGVNKIRAFLPIILFPTIIAVTGGLFCYILARHITDPIYRLRSAAASIAAGRLDARVRPTIGRTILKRPEKSDELALLARDFDHMAERIEALVDGQRRLLGDVSHELRSPLARLTVALGLAKQHPDETPEHLKRIGVETERLDKLVGQLLTLSRIESQVDSATGPVDLTNLVHEVASDGDFEARSRGKRVEVTVASACTLNASEELLRSALENVVRNAVRHTPEGSAVEVKLEDANDRVLIGVRDHGPGVPEERLAEIFLPFRHSEGGAGLGLAITERAVRSQGGSVRAANAAGGGLMVEIEIPHRLL